MFIVQHLLCFYVIIEASWIYEKLGGTWNLFLSLSHKKRNVSTFIPDNRQQTCAASKLSIWYPYLSVLTLLVYVLNQAMEVVKLIRARVTVK